MITLDRIPADDDPLLLWVAQDMRTGARAWAHGDAAAVACRDVSRRDRLALRGSPGDVAELLRRIRPQVTGFNPVADAALIDTLTGLVDGFERVARFGWMDTTTAPPPQPPVPAEPRWLAAAEIPEVAALLAAEHPGSWAQPGYTGVQRWAGVRDGAGVLQAVAAEAWSGPQLGFLAGVATRAAARGRGLGMALCAFLTGELLRGRSRVALLVDDDNAGAVRVYERLGYRLRPLAAARFTRP